MAKHSVQSGEMVATPEDQHLCCKIKKHRLHHQGHKKDTAHIW